jgi:hypothetical protein
LIVLLRAYQEGRPDVAAEQMRSFDKQTQELIQITAPLLVKATQSGSPKPSPHDLGLMQRQLEELAMHVSTKAPLFIEKALYCRDVKAFGRYEPLPEKYAFKPGALAELYIEVRNAPSVPVATPTQGDGYLTQLGCTLQMRDSQGSIIPMIERNSLKPVPLIVDSRRDFTYSPVHDYFVLLRFEVPSTPGVHSVTIELRDPLSHRAVSKTLPLRVQ